MARLANAFDLLGEDSFDVRTVVAIVDAKQDAADFLAAEKKKKEEAKEAERKRAEQRQRLKKKKLRDAVVNSVLAFPAYRPPSSFRRHPSFPQVYNDEQKQGQGVVHAPIVKKKWVPKSGENGAALAAVNSSSLELEKEKEKGKETEACDATVEKKQTKEGGVDGEEKTKEEVGSNNGGDGGSSSKSVDGNSRQNKNGSLRRKLRKQKKAADGGETKEAEDTKEGDTSSVQNQFTPRSYTLKEYEEMKKRESLKINDNDSSHQQQPQPPKKVTIDVNTEFRTPQERQGLFDNGGRRFNNGGRRFNNGGQRYNGERRFNNEGRRFDNGGQRFNNEGRRFDNGGQIFNNEGRRFDNGRQRSNKEGQRGLEFNLNDAEFPTLGRN
ncbi:uncharacterized protein LOC126783850 [Argentina anserina]|uniref:uncharacterized protein LOC126783850 n=1 Tax=Argentina anserina TaxID=57926 RepID=UPI0021763646|nr:uncharacterized protein LOC126783850 [Potentilla anserina]